MVYKFLDKKTSGGAVKLIFLDNIWGTNLADMQLINISNKGFEFLLYAINVYNKYVRVVLLKDKKGITIINAFQKN